MTSAKPKVAWYNYQTKSYDYLQDIPKDLRAYIPQDEAAQGIFNCHFWGGDSQREAARKTLTAVIEAQS